MAWPITLSERSSHPRSRSNLVERFPLARISPVDRSLILKSNTKGPIPYSAFGERFTGTTPTLLFWTRGGESRVTREMRRPVVGVVRSLRFRTKKNRRTPRPSLKRIRKNAPSFWIAAKDLEDVCLEDPAAAWQRHGLAKYGDPL